MSRFIYLAAPYSNGNTASKAERIAYFHLVNKAAGVLMASGLSVYSPISQGHVVEPHINDLGYNTTHAWWIEKCMPFLMQAQAVYVLMVKGWETSSGVQQEIQCARQLNKPIIFVEPLTIGLATPDDIEPKQGRPEQTEPVEVQLPADVEPPIAVVAAEEAAKRREDRRQMLARQLGRGY
jgi:hypothetical protein